MTTIIATISQTVADHDSPPSYQGGASLEDAVSAFLGADRAFTQYYDRGSFAQAGGDINISYDDDGAARLYGAFLPKGASDGTISVTQVQQVTPATLRADLQGVLNYHYAVSDGQLSLTSQGGTLNHVALASLEPVDSPQYDKLFGHSYASMDGAISVSSSGSVAGTINKLEAHADAILASSAYYGAFAVQGNSSAINVSGVLTSIDEHFTDGSFFRLTGGNIKVDSNTLIDESLLANAANFTGDDTFDIALPDEIHSNWTIAAGDGNDSISVRGGGHALDVDAGNGTDQIRLGDDGHEVDGGAGIDTVFLSGARSAYTVTANSNGGLDVKNAGGIFNTLSHVERIQFSDSGLAFDTDGAAGQIYRLYQAAFNRTPDAAGLGAWIKAVELNVSLHDVANGFAQSQEFHSIFGATPSNAEIVDHLYHNALHRDGEPAGVAHWLNLLNSHKLTVADALIAFSESAECHAYVATTIANGIDYIPYG